MSIYFQPRRYLTVIHIIRGLILTVVPSQLRCLGPFKHEALEDLTQPAYLMQQDRYLTFRGALAEACRDPSHFTTSEYKDFAATYDVAGGRAILSDLKQQRRCGTVSNPVLDSRVMELLVAAQRDATKTGQDAVTSAASTGDDPDDQAGSETLDVFLPLLFEDPTRATAWKMGAAFRETAEHIARGVGAATLCEYRRSGQRIRRYLVDRSSTDTHDERLDNWTKVWSKYFRKDTHLDATSRWRLLVMRHLLSDMVNQDIALPDEAAVTIILDGTAVLTWHLAHLSAQYQAVFYSLRMLKQVLGCRLQSEERRTRTSMAHGETCWSMLKTFPGIAAFFESKDATRDTQGRQSDVVKMLNQYGV